ncbi:MAG: SDR family oxidoreductase [Planctomycetes bacterium]|nr:SDR family oxidoreductase [Planctomycetota bacterium]
MVPDFLESLFGLKGQVAVVIGGTGTLGGALAEGLALAGADVIVAGNDAERGENRVRSILQSGGRARFVSANATSRDDLKKLLDASLQLRGNVDMLINCAGVNSAVPYAEITDDDWSRVIDANLTATHRGCQLFAPRMAEQPRGGAILNIGSVTAHIPLSKVFAYSAAKAAVLNLTKNLAREYGTRGVRINVLCPGFFPAEQNRKLLDEQRTTSIMSQTPMARFGEPRELVGAALLLLSRSAGSFITGSACFVDGGFTAMRF